MHKAGRIKRQKIKELQAMEKQAEDYSRKVNAHLDGLLTKAFAVKTYDLETHAYTPLEYIDATYLFDAMDRDVDNMHSDGYIPNPRIRRGMRFKRLTP